MIFNSFPKTFKLHLMKNENILILLAFIFATSSIFGQSRKELKKSTQEFRAEYKADFLEENRSPFYDHKENLQYLRFFKPKKKFRVKATFTRTPDEVPFEMATYSGMIKPYIKYGMLSFELKGKKQRMAVYQSLRLREIEEFKDYLFIPFKDFTNGEKTYGGGRYIDLKTGDIQNNELILDFNQCYNPWCAFSDGYNCPVPPLENHLQVAIKAGEKNFAKAVKH